MYTTRWSPVSNGFLLFKKKTTLPVSLWAVVAGHSSAKLFDGRKVSGEDVQHLSETVK